VVTGAQYLKDNVVDTAIKTVRDVYVVQFHKNVDRLLKRLMTLTNKPKTDFQTQSALEQLRKDIAEFNKVKGLTNAQLERTGTGIVALDKPFDAGLATLVALELEGTDAVKKALDVLHNAIIKSDAQTIPLLITNATAILNFVPEGNSLSALKGGSDPLTTSYVQLYNDVATAITNVATMATATLSSGSAADIKQACGKIITNLADLVVGDAYSGVAAKRFDGTDGLLFKDDIQKIITTAK